LISRMLGQPTTLCEVPGISESWLSGCKDSRVTLKYLLERRGYYLPVLV
jgi:hypothetical protein